MAFNFPIQIKYGLKNFGKKISRSGITKTNSSFGKNSFFEKKTVINQSKIFLVFILFVYLVLYFLDHIINY